MDAAVRAMAECDRDLASVVKQRDVEVDRRKMALAEECRSAIPAIEEDTNKMLRDRLNALVPGDAALAQVIGARGDY